MWFSSHFILTKATAHLCWMVQIHPGNRYHEAPRKRGSEHEKCQDGDDRRGECSDEQPDRMDGLLREVPLENRESGRVRGIGDYGKPTSNDRAGRVCARRSKNFVENVWMSAMAKIIVAIISMVLGFMTARWNQRSAENRKPQEPIPEASLTRLTEVIYQLQKRPAATLYASSSPRA